MGRGVVRLHPHRPPFFGLPLRREIARPRGRARPGRLAHLRIARLRPGRPPARRGRRAAHPGGQRQSLPLRGRRLHGRRDEGRPVGPGRGGTHPPRRRDPPESDAMSLAIRRGLNPADREPLEALIRATGFFNPEEIDVALELVDARRANGDASHYRFLVGELDGRVAGYACWGPIPGTVAAADLYLIVVHPHSTGRRPAAALRRPPGE